MTDTPDRNRRKSRVGVVVSDAADKTIAVEIQLSRAHPKYGKVVRKSRKLHAHDEANDAHVGDTVKWHRPAGDTETEIIEIRYR